MQKGLRVWMLVNSRDGDTSECWKTKWSLRLNVGYWWWWGPMPEYLRTKRSSHLNVGFWLVDVYYHIQLTVRWVNIQVWGPHYHLQPTFRWGDLLVLNDSSVGTPPLLVNSIKAWVTLRNDGFFIFKHWDMGVHHYSLSDIEVCANIKTWPTWRYEYH